MSLLVPDQEATADDPLAAFHDDLMALRAGAGAPSYERLARRIGQPRSTVYDAFTRPSLPSLDLLLALVTALKGDVDAWRARWTDLRAQQDVTGSVEPAQPSEAPEKGARTSSDGRSWRRMLPYAVVALVAALLAGGLTAVATGGDSSSPCTRYRVYRMDREGDLIDAASRPLGKAGAGDTILLRTVDKDDRTFHARYPVLDANTNVRGFVNQSPLTLLHDDVCLNCGYPIARRDMHLGVHLAQFTYPSGPANLAKDLTRIATVAEDQGFTRLSVMDHVWQIEVMGPPEQDMLEAYTTLGYLAARTTKIELLAWVTAVVYREPGLLAKIVTTLDVLSEGRAMLGIGAAWNEDESRGLGLSFPSTAERFERLEEALQICLQMWSSAEDPYVGKHYQLARTLNSPQPIRRPPILIGGGGEKKTLRMVAQYAQACNLFDSPDLARKLDVLRERCSDVGRDYDEIEKTVITRLDSSKADDLLKHLRELADLGIQHVHGTVKDVQTITPLEILGQRVIPEVAGW